ncbi:MAG: Gfo/Idh/MocA family oxidoreductase [Anaerolineae bacterium]|nr:Gfo/Idh/MocA family oxidoreductase [Anaerolineae bacterium]
MAVLRTGIVGLGRIGWQFHAPQAAAHAGFALVAAVDPLEARREEAVARYGVRAYATYEEMLAAEALDLVVIASPTPFHVEQALAAFAQGCDVFCDKPMAPTLADADRVIDAARASGRKLMVYQPHRARADVVALRQILAEGWIGPLYMCKCARTAYIRRNDWQAFRAYGGGMLNNYGAHFVDLLLYLAGSRARRVSCAMRTVASLGDAEDVIKAVIETEDGAILDLDINMASAHPMPEWHVLGQRGSIVYDEAQRAWHVRYYRAGTLGEGIVYRELAAPGRRYGNVETIPWEERTVPVAREGGIDYYAQCYAFFAEDKPPFVPVEETREVMRVLDLCRQEAERGAPALDKGDKP